jgi:drug/metabolite transporter (DMT)-like permease
VNTPQPRRNAPVWVTVLLALLGVALVVVAVVYFADSAGKLPAFFPGHDPGSLHHHTKHGLAALVLALACFAAAWMSTGGKRSSA